MPGNLESFPNFKLSQLKPAELNVFTPNYTSRVIYNSTIFMLTNINFSANIHCTYGFKLQGPYCFVKIIIINHNCIVRDFLNEPISFWLHI